MKHSFYFDHDYNASLDSKVLALRSEFNNWEGYGIYFGTLEQLCRNGGYIQRGALGGLSIGLSIPLTTLTKFIDFCIELGLFHEDVNGIFSERILEHLAMRKKFSESGKRGGLMNKGKQSPPLSPPLSQVKAPPEAGEDRRVKESKEKDAVLKSDKSDSCSDFVLKFNEATGRKFRPNAKVERQLKARLKEGYTIDEIITAAINAKATKHHQENPQYLTPEFITRVDKIEMYREKVNGIEVKTKPVNLHPDLFWIDGIGECLKPNPIEFVVTWDRYLNTLQYQGRPIDYRNAANYFRRYPTTWNTLPKEITAQYEQQV
jgi:uncharacterized phage protein (TIGR02220 family)